MESGVAEFHERRMLYLQVRDYILDQIERGVFAPGELILPERELAERLKISRYTVRRALQELVDEGILFRVQGSGTYVREKSSPTTKRVDSIGIVMPFCHAEIEMMLLSGMQKVLRGTPYSMTLHTTDNNSSREREGIARLMEEGVAGLILMPSQDQGGGQAALALKRAGFPFVVVDRAIEAFQTDCVVSDNVQGGNQATTHLIELGHRNIAFLHHGLDASSSINHRLHGFREAFREHGLEPGITLGYDPDATTGGLKDFLAAHECTAVICGNAVVALDVVKACRELQMAIPQDLSIVSFDDLSIVQMLDVSLTTVTQSSELIGEKAVRLLLDRIQNGRSEASFLTQHFFPTKLIVRDSCAKLTGTKGR